MNRTEIVKGDLLDQVELHLRLQRLCVLAIPAGSVV